MEVIEYTFELGAHESPICLIIFAFRIQILMIKCSLFIYMNLLAYYNFFLSNQRVENGVCSYLERHYVILKYKCPYLRF